jgi:two-component system LytT family response regulator/two-component system response regulator AlgR
MSLRVVVADDEPLARKRLGRLLREAGCEVLGEFPNSAQVLEWFEGGPEVDALFLDIQMPGLSGLELLAEFPAPPPVVFVTAHVHYAIQAFEAAAVDYILKPATEDRLAKTLQRLQAHLVPRRQGPELAALLPSESPRFPVKAGEGFIFLDLRKVTHFEVEAEVVYAWAGERFRTAWTTLAEVEAAFPKAGLIRIQRHLLIRPELVVGLKPLWAGRGQVRMAGGMELEVSRGTMPRLKTILGLG